jgi:hypothetical protein
MPPQRMERKEGAQKHRPTGPICYLFSCAPQTAYLGRNVAYTNLPISFFNAAKGIAPEIRCTSTPFLNRIMVGMADMPYCCARCCFSSVFTFTTTMRPFQSCASTLSTGAIILQGPHQSAQKSVSTGRSLDRINSLN